MALQAKLYADCRVNGVVDTLVVRNKTPQQTAIGSIYDSINFKSCNVALPKPQTLVDIRNLRTGKVVVRTRKGQDLGTFTVEEFLDILKKQVRNRDLKLLGEE